MKRAVPFAALMIAVTAGAAALRLPDLDSRPMHCDEANEAVKFGRLLEQGHYVYDPREHHGPSLNFLTLPIARLVSAQKLTQITETHLRLLPAIFGIAMVGLPWFLRDELGRAPALCAGVLTAASPAMVFYSRYYIQEILLVTFTFGAMVALWRFTRAVPLARRRCSGEGHGQDARLSRPWVRQAALWPVLLGLCLGMMHATKETCVIAVLAMAAAAALTLRGLGRIRTNQIVLSALVVMLVAASVSALLFSSFLDNPAGIIDSYTTYFYYLDRASGQGSVGPQAYPWYHYLRILFWSHRDGGPVWTEVSIAALALVGLVAGVFGKGLGPANLSMPRFLGVYTVLMTVIYSALPYKTPWCALGFLHGLILLAGVGAAVLVRLAPGHAMKVVVVVVLAAATGHLAWQAYRASFPACDDPGNPYAHTPTARDVPLLARRVEQIAAVHPDAKDMHVQVICPDDDYWPLPWYLRGFRRVGWFNRMPSGPPAPLIITQQKTEASLLEYLYSEQPPGKRHLYVPVPPEGEHREWQLRPFVPLRVYARLDLWDN